jgi:hypothetical protein
MEPGNKEIKLGQIWKYLQTDTAYKIVEIKEDLIDPQITVESLQTLFRQSLRQSDFIRKMFYVRG